MARKRMLDPSIWTDEGMAELEPRQQLLYIGLISNADDDGRIKGSPAAISLMLPTVYSTRDRGVIEEDLKSVLSCMTQLIRYEVEGRPYLAFKNYRQWQRIDKPTPSILPPPPAETPKVQPKSPSNQFDSGIDLGGVGEVSPSDPGEVPPKRIEGNGIEQKVGEGNREGGAGAPTPPPKPPTKGTRLPDDFTVTDDMRSWARSEGATDRLIDFETDKFLDYWPTVPGQKGVKLDWGKTWKNWMRRAIQEAPAGSLRIVKGNESPFAGRGYDPLRSMTPEEEAVYQEQLKRAEEEYERKWGTA